MRISRRKFRQILKYNALNSNQVAPSWLLVLQGMKGLPKAIIRISNGTPTSRQQVLQVENSLLEYMIISLRRLGPLVSKIAEMREKKGDQCLL